SAPKLSLEVPSAFSLFFFFCKKKKMLAKKEKPAYCILRKIGQNRSFWLFSLAEIRYRLTSHNTLGDIVIHKKTC
ncbi:MAG: hypothetical protein L6Q54_15545, partial [Leptospiraceae bacterium]|nr:hypothetical protein [Leptospiraceae bacterium]